MERLGQGGEGRQRYSIQQTQREGWGGGCVEAEEEWVASANGQQGQHKSISMRCMDGRETKWAMEKERRVNNSEFRGLYAGGGGV